MAYSALSMVKFVLGYSWRFSIESIGTHMGSNYARAIKGEIRWGNKINIKST